MDKYSCLICYLIWKGKKIRGKHAHVERFVKIIKKKILRVYHVFSITFSFATTTTTNTITDNDKILLY